MDTLYKQLSPQEFGRVMQQVLACSFEVAAFDVVENAVGVPDFTATSPLIDGACQTIAVEVKTTDKSKIPLKQRDLDGIRNPGQIGVLAVLIFPAKNPGWLLIQADSISARAWELRHLKMKPQVDVGFDADAMLHRVVAGLETQLVPGGSDLEGWIKAQRHAFHATISQQEPH
ncbi:MAG: hypothetical protein ACRDZR_00735 [Acidimicrobiales bacterium]